MRVQGTEAESFVLHKPGRGSNQDHPTRKSNPISHSSTPAQSTNPKAGGGGGGGGATTTAAAAAADNHVIQLFIT